MVNLAAMVWRRLLRKRWVLALVFGLSLVYFLTSTFKQVSGRSPSCVPPGAAGRSPGRRLPPQVGELLALQPRCSRVRPGRRACLPGTEDGRGDLLPPGDLGEQALLGRLLGLEPGVVALIVPSSCFLPAPPACISRCIFGAALGGGGWPRSRALGPARRVCPGSVLSVHSSSAVFFPPLSSPL